MGNLTFSDLEVPRVTGAPSVTYALNASAYKPGMIYQFRVTSWRDMKGTRTYISASEDLRGVFEISR